MKKFLLLTLFTFFLTCIFVGSVSANGKELKELATQKETMHFVKKYLKENLDIKFKEKDIVDIEPLYDVSEELLGYEYRLTNKNNQDYFFIISAQKIHSPILAAGEGESETINLSTDGNLKSYFMGGFTVARAVSADHLLNYIEEANPEYSEEELLDILLVSENPDASKEWNIESLQTSTSEELNSEFSQSDTFADLITDEHVDDQLQVNNDSLTTYDEEEFISTAASTSQSRIINVPFFNQFDSTVISSRRGSSCGPATQSAILEYWRLYKSKSGIKGVSHFGSKGAFINYMYNTYGGTYLGMSISNVGTGVVSQAQKGGYQATRTTFNNFTTYMTEVKNYRPMAVKFDKIFTWDAPNRKYAYNYHWTVGVGYTYDSSTSKKTLKVHTNGGIRSDGSVAPSRVVSVDYTYNSPIISMIKFNIF